MNDMCHFLLMCDFAIDLEYLIRHLVAGALFNTVGAGHKEAIRRVPGFDQKCPCRRLSEFSPITPCHVLSAMTRSLIDWGRTAAAAGDLVSSCPPALPTRAHRLTSTISHSGFLNTQTTIRTKTAAFSRHCVLPAGSRPFRPRGTAGHRPVPSAAGRAPTAPCPAARAGHSRLGDGLQLMAQSPAPGAGGALNSKTRMLDRHLSVQSR